MCKAALQRHRMAEEMEARLRELFAGIDADADGALSREELATKLRADSDLQQLLEGAGKSAHYVFEQLDADGDGSITVDEFVKLCAPYDDEADDGAEAEPAVEEGEEEQSRPLVPQGTPPPPVGGEPTA